MKEKNPLFSQIKSAWAITKKDINIYYLKAPVLIYGLIFPCFLFLAFFLGKNMPFTSLLPVVLAIAVFFTSSSVGPIITPWETRLRTLERLISCPVSLEFILLGDALASFLFGVGVTLVLFLFSIPFVLIGLKSLIILIAGVTLSSLSFSCLGILLSSPATDNPSNIMMLSNLVRLPLVFISGIFISFNKLPGLGKLIARFSPLTYTVDILRYSFHEEHQFPIGFSLGILFISTAIFLFLGMILHKRNLSYRF